VKRNSAGAIGEVDHAAQESPVLDLLCRILASQLQRVKPTARSVRSRHIGAHSAATTATS
jgi:hypothetical protein